MLVSSYGRWGLKDFDSETKIVTTKEAQEISLKYQVLENNIFESETGL